MTKNCRTNTLSPAFTLPRQIFSEMTKHGRTGEGGVGGGGVIGALSRPELSRIIGYGLWATIKQTTKKQNKRPKHNKRKISI